MPELPELEVFKRYVDSTSLHQDIEMVEATSFLRPLPFEHSKVLIQPSAWKVNTANFAKTEFSEVRLAPANLLSHLRIKEIRSSRSTLE